MDPRYPLRIDLRHNHSRRGMKIIEDVLASTMFSSRNSDQKKNKGRESKDNEEMFLGTRTTGRNDFRAYESKLITKCFSGEKFLHNRDFFYGF